ncbi:MAG: CDP-alcohol phosphatidyltransferase family protein [SAR202 cluster bacterium]|nr:CDP-alcohol phosphatidyltransferase family protein [SAR202 cluster bacterium]
MAIPGREQFRAAVLRYIELPGAKFFRAIKFTPNGITILGFLIAVVAAYLVGSGWLIAGGIVFLFGGGLDLMDGALARLTNKTSPFGALLDSVFDRLSEAALFVGLAIYALRADLGDDRQIFFVTILLLALIFSQGVSYLRARGEGLGVFTKAGLMTRPERVVLLGAGLIVGQIEWFLLAIAVVSCFTLFQRMFTIRGMLDKAG